MSKTEETQPINIDNSKITITFYKGLTTDDIYIESVLFDCDDGTIKTEFAGSLQANVTKNYLNVEKCKNLFVEMEKLLNDRIY